MNDDDDYDDNNDDDVFEVINILNSRYIKMHLLWISFSSERINSGNEDDKNEELKLQKKNVWWTVGSLSVSQEIFTTFCNSASAEALQVTAKAWFIAPHLMHGEYDY